jgi:hypothetical protein
METLLIQVMLITINKKKNITADPLLKIYIYSSMEDSEVVLIFERNKAVLNNL